MNAIRHLVVQNLWADRAYLCRIGYHCAPHLIVFAFTQLVEQTITVESAGDGTGAGVTGNGVGE